jgi:hypothetical protein
MHAIFAASTRAERRPRAPLALLLLGLLACGRSPAPLEGGMVADPSPGAPPAAPVAAPAPEALPDAPPPGSPVPGPESATPPALDPALPRQTVTLSALVACTRMMCPPDRPCCNRCSALKWSKGGLHAEAAAGAPPLPTPAPDGCGAVPDDLVAVGVEQGGTLWVESWTLQPKPATAP